MPAKSTARRNFTPPEVADRFHVATAKVIGWIRSGELRALNLANRGCTRPRFSITPEALEDFERARQVVPDNAGAAQRRVRRQQPAGVREFV